MVRLDSNNQFLCSFIINYYLYEDVKYVMQQKVNNNIVKVVCRVKSTTQRNIESSDAGINNQAMSTHEIKIFNLTFLE